MQNYTTASPDNQVCSKVGPQTHFQTCFSRSGAAHSASAEYASCSAFLSEFFTVFHYFSRFFMVFHIENRRKPLAAKNISRNPPSGPSRQIFSAHFHPS